MKVVIQTIQGVSEIRVNVYNPRFAAISRHYDKKYMFNPIPLRETKIVYNFGFSECNRVKMNK